MKRSRTKKMRNINEKTLITTVDIGKVTNMGYCRCPDRSEVEPFEFFNNGRGFNKFYKCIQKTIKIQHLEEVIVGFESTGPYGEPLTHYLRVTV